MGLGGAAVGLELLDLLLGHDWLPVLHALELSGDLRVIWGRFEGGVEEGMLYLSVIGRYECVSVLKCDMVYVCDYGTSFVCVYSIMRRN